MSYIVRRRRVLSMSAPVVALLVAATTQAGCVFCGFSDAALMDESAGYSPPPPNAEELIAEADILEVVGDWVYALSEERLSIIDLSQRSSLTVLGQIDASGEPQEMFVRDGQIFVMSDFEGQSVTLVTRYDVSAQGEMVRRGDFTVDGHLSDSRLYDDVIYLVTFEDSATAPTTTITSLDAHPAAPLARIDQLAFSQDAHGLGLRRSVMMNTQRMYVAGVEWDELTNEGHSTIQVIDIASGGGYLHEGASVEVEGQIISRWQMDEYEGVLRVASQPGIWSNASLPSLETFEVVSSAEIVPLAQIDFFMPVRESLRSVRFDGPRAYAITANEPGPYDPTAGADTAAPPPPPVDRCGPDCDPLFIFDLSDPAHPGQMGMLEMPGWVFHMEPRGDQLIALGFEGTAPLGKLNLSLFDVSVANAPKLVNRVVFGNDMSGYAEDQNRIHKSLSIFEEQGLIAVPYGYWAMISVQRCSDGDMCSDANCWDESYWVRRGAVKLVDWTDGDLINRGSIDTSHAWALRARMHDDDLVVMSEDSVSLFDIHDRATPRRLSAAGI